MATGKNNMGMIASLALPVGAMALVGARIAWYYPENHVGFEPMWPAGAVCVMAWALVAAVWVLGARVSIGMLSAVALATVLLMLGTFAADRFNLLVSYDTWIGRGMPGPFKHHGRGP